MEADNVVAQRQPDVGADVDTDIDARAVVDHARFIGVVDAGARADVPAIVERPANIDTDQVGVPRVGIAIELAAHVLERVLQGQRSCRAETVIGVEVIDEAPALFLDAGQLRRVENQVDAVQERPFAVGKPVCPAELEVRRQQLVAGQVLGAEHRQAGGQPVARGRFAVPAEQCAGALLGVGVAVLDARIRAPQVRRVQRTREHRHEVLVVGTGGQLTVGVDRPRRRLEDRVRVVGTDVERPAFADLEALHQAHVRKQPRSELGVLVGQRRVDLRPCPGRRANADAGHLRLDIATIGLLVLGNQVDAAR